MSTWESSFTDWWNQAQDLSPLSKPVQNHLIDVYRTLAFVTCSAVVGVYLQMAYFMFMNPSLALLASFGVMIWLLNTPPTNENTKKREILLYTFALCNGLYIGPLVSVFTYVDSAIILMALGGTAVIFITFTLSAIFNTNRSYLLMGGMLMSALSLLFWTSLINMFFRIELVTTFQLYFGLLVMSGFVLFDTQLIIFNAGLGYMDHVGNALRLFQDLFTIFVRLMIILARNRSVKENRNRRRRE